MTRRYIISVGLALGFVVQTAIADWQDHRDETAYRCGRVLKMNINEWKKQAMIRLNRLATLPLHVALVAEHSPRLLAMALQIQAAQIPQLHKYKFSLELEDARARLRIKNWPTIQSALISLKYPTVIHNFANAEGAAKALPDASLPLAVQATTHLFYEIKEVAPGIRLGMTVPLIDVNFDPSKPPMTEIEIGLLMRCGQEPDERGPVYEDDHGQRLCLDDLLVLSTWQKSDFN